MRVDEIAPGLWRWTGDHPEWTPEEDWPREVGSVYYEEDGQVVLIDPLVPPDEAERFWAALDRDVERAGGPVHVLLTIFWHARSAREIADRYAGSRIWVHEPARELVAERGGSTDVFRAGETLPGGVVAVDAHRAFEVLFWIPAHRTLVAGDVLLGTTDGGLRLAEEWIAGRDPNEVRAALQADLGDLPVERVLVAHWEPVLTDARAALERALHSPPSAA